jgi:hypothetical protein
MERSMSEPVKVVFDESHARNLFAELGRRLEAGIMYLTKALSWRQRISRAAYMFYGALLLESRESASHPMMIVGLCSPDFSMVRCDDGKFGNFGINFGQRPRTFWALAHYSQNGFLPSHGDFFGARLFGFSFGVCGAGGLFNIVRSMLSVRLFAWSAGSKSSLAISAARSAAVGGLRVGIV